MTRFSAAVLTTLTLTGCTHRLAPLPVAIPVPDPPALPTIAEHEVQCLNSETWRKLVLRDALRAADAAELRAILTAIRSPGSPP